jgi:hypothetical protein
LYEGRPEVEGRLKLCNVGWAKSAALAVVNKGVATSEGGSSVQMERRAGRYSQ